MKELAYSYIEFGEEYWWASVDYRSSHSQLYRFPLCGHHYPYYPSGNLGYIEIVCSFQYDINR